MKSKLIPITEVIVIILTIISSILFISYLKNTPTYGKSQIANRGTYIGMLKNGIPEGYGKLTFTVHCSAPTPMGARFGAIACRQGDVEIGNFKDGKPLGYVEIQAVNGKVWFKGNVNGYGKMYDGRTGEISQEGQFQGDDFFPTKGIVGYGKIYSNGSIYYEGGLNKTEYDSYSPQGYGKEYRDNVLTYAGSYRNSMRNGFGREYRLFTGTLDVEGYFENGGISYGKKYDNKGKLDYTGYFQDGNPIER